MPRRLHANHNFEVCSKLHTGKLDMECNDWVVTTAFYSAIHFIDHVLFPLEAGNETYKSIREAHNNRSGIAASEHQTRSRLVNLYKQDLNKEYKYLLDACHLARYNNYIIHPQIANTCYNYLEKIKKVCDIEKRPIK